MRKRMVVMGSGRGTNFEAIVNYIRERELPIDVVLCITDNPKAGIIERAKRLGVPVKVLDYKAIGDKGIYNQMLLTLLRNTPFDLLVLAGYMRILPPEIVNEFKGRIVNIHPSLLPAFPGLNAIERAMAHGVKITGVTVHFVDEGVDTGPIIDQEAVRIEEGDTLESLEERIHRVEHRLYPRVIERLLLEEGL